MKDLSLIMLDQIDWETFIGPTHILTKDFDFIPVYIGKSLLEDTKEDYIGIYTTYENYNKINHKKTYILIHSPDISEESKNEILDFIKNNSVSIIRDEAENDWTNCTREHIHICKPDDGKPETFH